MKKLFLVLSVLVLSCTLFVSCTTTSKRAEKIEMLPEMHVYSLNELDSSQYAFIGNVTGTSSFTVDGDMADKYSFAGALYWDAPQNIFSDDPNSIDSALNKALFDMASKAKKLNANAIILPSYSVDSVVTKITTTGLILSGSSSYTTDVTVTVSAVAVKLLDGNGNDLPVY